MKKTYDKPVLAKVGALPQATAESYVGCSYSDVVCKEL